MLSRDNATTAVVFSHPNHELAIFGLLQSLRPQLVYLTDGGGEARVEQTRRGLETIGLGDHAHFLGYTEKSFYDALLDRAVGFYREVAGRLGSVLDGIRPMQVLCDSVEFYNPVHDLSLPLVRAALCGSASPRIFEVPLVYQRPTDAAAGTVAYDVQRASMSRRDEQIEWRLAPIELHVKLDARDRIYTILTNQMGVVLSGVPVEEFSVEVVTPAPASLPAPDEDRVLRYEWRAQTLIERGEIERAITYADHYLPVASALF